MTWNAGMDRDMREPEMTAQESAAMGSINPHFTFRERTAFLVGYRLAAEAKGDPVKHVAEQTHSLTKELYEKLAHRRANKFQTGPFAHPRKTEPTTLMLLEHTNTMLTIILDKV